MAECTNIDLRRAREAAKLARWQAAQQTGVSEETLRRWETGETRPEPDDVWNLERIYGCCGLWHRWMRSAYDSYRENWPETRSLDLPLAIVNVRHQLQDVLSMQDAMERDAMDGVIDDMARGSMYLQEMEELQAALAAAARKMGEKMKGAKQQC